jgi:flavin reductase (DIM6/NTAB) family NADH-FMN oxidoreductase RutF
MPPHGLEALEARVAIGVGPIRAKRRMTAQSRQFIRRALPYPTMQIDPAVQAKSDNYKLLTNLVVPRPIAWVTSINPSGLVNLAPFSFFNAVGSDPIFIVIGVAPGRGGSPKDTAANIESTGDFVVNLVTEELLDAMNLSAADFPADESELTAAKLQASPSTKIKTPRLEQAQASMECKLFRAEKLGSSTLIIGEVVMFHVADRLVGPRMHIHGFAPIGRLGSPSTYCRTTARFELPRMDYDQWKQGR